MLQSNKVQESLLHLIGWQQSYDTQKVKLAESLTETESGLYYQQAHPLLTLDNLESLAPDFRAVNYDIYDPEKEYTVGTIIDDGGTVLYKAIANSVNKPLSDTNYWKETNAFSEWLENKTKASIQRAITRFYTDKLAKLTAKDLVENMPFFDGTGRITDTVRNQNNLVGLEIIPIRSMGITLKINAIGLQFTQPGDYTIYIFHSSSSEPIKTLTLHKTKANTMEWFKFQDIYLPYVSQYTDAGGSWYICYKQSSLPEGSKAIKKDRDWSKGPCKSCSRVDYIAWSGWSKYLEVHPFYVNEELLTEEISLWDIEQNLYDYHSNYGLNLNISLACDYTDFIISQRNSFIDILMKQVAIDILREFAYNPNVRTNRHAINASRTDILYELDGDSGSMKKSGLNYQLEQAFKALELSFEGIDRICLPCKNNGLRYRTV